MADVVMAVQKLNTILKAILFSAFLVLYKAARHVINEIKVKKANIINQRKRKIS